MAEITATLVRQLRDATNVSMMECKRALVEANGDLQSATKLLRERGMAVAAKKASRAANQGLIASATAENGKIASLVEVNCETDFVARNEIFKKFVADLAQKACSTDKPLANELGDMMTSKIAEIGENLIMKRNLRFVAGDNAKIASYIHLGGKVGVLIELAFEKAETAEQPVFEDLIKDLTLHVAACSPRFLESKDVPEAEIKSEREIYAKQVEGKPAQIVDKIVDGKIRKFYSDTCLVDQPFVKEAKQSITQLLTEKGKALGDTLTIRRFARYQLGE